MIVGVNGEQVAFEPGATVETVLEQLALPPAGIAVALNGEVVPRSAWAGTPLAPDDRIEVLTAAQGG